LDNLSTVGEVVEVFLRFELVSGGVAKLFPLKRRRHRWSLGITPTRVHASVLLSRMLLKMIEHEFR